MGPGGVVVGEQDAGVVVVGFVEERGKKKGREGTNGEEVEVSMWACCSWGSWTGRGRGGRGRCYAMKGKKVGGVGRVREARQGECVPKRTVNPAPGFG